LFYKEDKITLTMHPTNLQTSKDGHPPKEEDISPNNPYQSDFTEQPGEDEDERYLVLHAKS
jgi:hypothetical protein